MIAGQTLAPDSIRQLTKMFIERNTGRLPPEFEHGLESFLTTLQVDGAHVRWGAPPPNPDRDWARIALLATNPEYAGRAGILLFNLQKGARRSPAYHNAFNKTKAEIEAEVDRFWAARQFVRRRCAQPSAQCAARFRRPPARSGCRRPGNRRPDDAAVRSHLQAAHRQEVRGWWIATRVLRCWLCAVNDSLTAGDYLNKAMAAGSQNAAILVRMRAWRRILKRPARP